MTLIKSISGIRGTIGGNPGEALTPVDLVQFASAYAVFLKQNNDQPTIVVGRDGRVSGSAVANVIIGSLQLSGCHVIDAGLSTTPTVEMAVPYHKADGGIILTASHNPAEWNALKFLNEKGEFISAKDGEDIMSIIASSEYQFCEYNKIGKVSSDENAIIRHIDAILDLSYIDVEQIRKRQFRIVVDAINSTGALAIPVLLDKLNVSYEIINSEVSGLFSHNPEPLPTNLDQLSKAVKEQNADLGIAVDPDVDRLAFFGPDGQYFGEEYTLVAAADFILDYKVGDTVSNLSSTKALTDLSNLRGVTHHQSAVGEVNVVNLMKSKGAIIGGEGNGGVILPDLHYGRDALVGIAMILGLLTSRNTDLNSLRSSYSNYEMKKDKIQLSENIDPEEIIKTVEEKYVSSYDISTVDGIKVFFDHGWVHLRKSNTEPIIRVYSEGRTQNEATEYVEHVKNTIADLI